ncbi:MAG TPA: hypothetical protein DEQ14_09945, partial [Treponema sp.]|nr:hypothetical protein [Treponema sp.]
RCARLERKGVGKKSASLRIFYLGVFASAKTPAEILNSGIHAADCVRGAVWKQSPFLNTN